MTHRPKYRQGRPIWVWLRSGGGKKQKHPAVIITADRDIIQPEHFDPRKNIDQVNAVAVASISTKFRRYPPYVQLPHSTNRGGHPMTKLTQECGVCIGWYDWVVLEDDILGRGGDVPFADMDRIMVAIVEDFKARLANKANVLSKDLANVNDLLAKLIGEP